MSYLWLILQILPLLLIVAALFYWLGLRQPRADLADTLAARQEALDREQTKADALSRQLSMAEEQINQLTSDYDKLQRGAIPRRLLSEAENEIIKLQRQLETHTTPAFSYSQIPPTPEFTPAPPDVSEPPAAEPIEDTPVERSLAEILASLSPLQEPDPETSQPEVPPTESIEPMPKADLPPSPLKLEQPLFIESDGTPKPPPIQKRRKKSKP